MSISYIEDQLNKKLYEYNLTNNLYDLYFKYDFYLIYPLIKLQIQIKNFLLFVKEIVKEL
jgi:hypothetical protein